jgi:gamma-glutamylcyclotransferase (GGCT)/AIG2-like uncharacterized protein YtfP
MRGDLHKMRGDLHKMISLFVYGTLLEEISYGIMLRASSYYYENATFNGILYSCGQFPFVKPSTDPKDIVHGEIHFINETSIIKVLDMYEGPMFDRQIHPVNVYGKEIYAWIYIGYIDGEFEQIKSGKWLEYARKDRRYFGDLTKYSLIKEGVI